MNQDAIEISEGWNGDNFYSLFPAENVRGITSAYGLSVSLPGYLVVGLVGWDDFLLFKEGELYSCPTVPAVSEQIERWQHGPPATVEGVSPRPGKVKWYVKPLIFGGDPTDESNVEWVDYSKHQKLVRWWNAKYSELQS